MRKVRLTNYCMKKFSHHLLASFFFAFSWSSVQAQYLGPELDSCRELLAADQYQEGLACVSEIARTLEIPTGFTKVQDLSGSDLDIQKSLLYRALAREFTGDFIGAQGDYHSFLGISSFDGLNEIVDSRLRHVHLQTTEELGFLAPSELDSLNYFFDQDFARTRVVVVPFQNNSELEVLGPIGYALAGYLQQAIDDLGPNTNVSISSVESSQLRSGMAMVDTRSFGIANNPYSPAVFGKLVDAEYVVSGSVSEVLGSLVATYQISLASNGTVYSGPSVEATVTSEGLLSLQKTLIEHVVDEIRDLRLFEWVESKEAYLESIESLYTADVNGFLDYGNGYKEITEGDYSRAETILTNSDLILAERDLAALPGNRRSLIQTFDGLEIMTASDAFDPNRKPADPEPDEPEDAVVLVPLQDDPPEEAPDLLGEDLAQPVQDVEETVSQPAVSHHQQTLPLLFDLSLRSLGQSSISNPTVGFRGPSLFGGSHFGDPRDGTAGSLDPSRSSNGGGITIIVPLPTGSRN